MKLIKISLDHYIIVDESEIKEGDWYWNELDKAVRVNNTINHSYHKKITHSTQPLEPYTYDEVGEEIYGYEYDKIQQLPLSEVKELLGECIADEKAIEWYNGHPKYDSSFIADPYSYKEGYNQALEDNKDRKYTEEDMRKAMELYKNTSIPLDDIIQSLQPPTSWDVEFVDGKLKLI